MAETWTGVLKHENTWAANPQADVQRHPGREKGKVEDMCSFRGHAERVQKCQFWRGCGTTGALVRGQWIDPGSRFSRKQEGLISSSEIFAHLATRDF